jgi:alanine dehydrogenase
MRIGVPKEIKNHEYRVGLTPASVRELAAHGHEVLVEAGAGTAIGLTDEQYRAAGGQMVPAASDIFARAEMIVKVKEPLRPERKKLRRGQIIFTYLHLAADRALTDDLMAAGVIAIAYETVTSAQGSLPLLTPMSEVAGRMAPHVGARCLEKENGGRGVLLGGVPGVPPAKVVVLGGGIVGYNAALIAVGMQADVWVLERSVDRMRELDTMLGGRITLSISNRHAVEEAIVDADLVIGAVLVHGAKAPHLVTRDMLGLMKRAAVLVDVAIDQGGCFETSRPTTHSDPVYEVDGVVHYCVANMPGAVPITSTKGLTNVTLPFVELIARYGAVEAMRRSKPLARGLNVMNGKVVNEAVAEAVGVPYTPIGEVAEGVAV